MTRVAITKAKCPTCGKKMRSPRPRIKPLGTGRIKHRNDEQIKELRAKGLSIRAIAREIGMSTMAVQRGLKS